MITVKKLAEKFEEGLNSILNNTEIRFKIWAEAGECRKPVRKGNLIEHEIVGSLKTASSSNDANNLLAMGINELNLDFLIPIYPPCTGLKQTAERLEKISGEQYPFLVYITQAINDYFQRSQTFTMRDESGVVFSVAFQAGTAMSDSVEVAAKYGNAVPYNVFVQVYFIEDGMNSKDIKISVDGKLMPFQSVRIGRAAIMERDVCAGESISKCFASSTAFSVDADFPSSNNPATQTALNYLIEGEPNTVHFVGVKWGSDSLNKLFLMTHNTVQASATGISIAGISEYFIEVGGNVLSYNLPKNFHLVRFTVNDSQNRTLSFNISDECETFIAGVGAVKRKGTQIIKLTSNSFEYDEETDKYIINLIVDRQIDITESSAPFTMV